MSYVRAVCVYVCVCVCVCVCVWVGVRGEGWLGGGFVLTTSERRERKVGTETLERKDAREIFR